MCWRAGRARRAKKEHVCGSCGDPIPVGIVYERWVHVPDDLCRDLEVCAKRATVVEHVCMTCAHDWQHEVAA